MGVDISSPFGPVQPPLAELPPPYDFQSAVYDAVVSDAVLRPPGPATALGGAIAAEAATRRPPTPAYAADYATVRTAVHHCADANGSVAGPTESTARIAAVIVAFQRAPLARVTENMAPPPGRVNAVHRPLRTATATATAGFAAWRRCYDARPAHCYRVTHCFALYPPLATQRHFFHCC